jgi:hypothetical protein
MVLGKDYKEARNSVFFSYALRLTISINLIIVILII